jgi:hypothetical protein
MYPTSMLSSNKLIIAYSILLKKNFEFIIVGTVTGTQYYMD